jgi:hypothetical protein
LSRLVSRFIAISRIMGARRLLAAVVVIGGLLTIALAIGPLRDDPTKAGTGSGAVAMQEMTPGELDAFSRRVGHSIFWAGERAGTQLSAGRSPTGTVIVKYDGAADSPLDGLMVATYPMADAAGNLRRQAARDPRYELTTIRDGRLLLIDSENADHAYLAEPGADQQIEVHSSVGDRALRLATQGRIVACCGA